MQTGEEEALLVLLQVSTGFSEIKALCLSDTTVLLHSEV